MDQVNKKKILVTGGAGYIGSHTVVELQKMDFEVVIIDNLSNSHAGVVDRIAEITGIRPEFHRFDLTDPMLTASFFKTHPDLSGIIHFAAFKAVGESVIDPLRYYRNNLDSLINILQGMKESKVANLVFSSSCTVYGQPDSLPVKETSPIQEAWSPYGNTKQMSEQILRFSVPAYGLKTIALRYFNPTGAHESALIGELPLGAPNNLVPFITQTAIGRRECLQGCFIDHLVKHSPRGTRFLFFGCSFGLQDNPNIRIKARYFRQFIETLKVIHGPDLVNIAQSFEKIFTFRQREFRVNPGLLSYSFIRPENYMHRSQPGRLFEEAHLPGSNIIETAADNHVFHQETLIFTWKPPGTASSDTT